MKTFYDWCIENNREDLLKEWHPIKNGTNTPYNVGYGCNAKHWWKCEQGHEWEARPSSRAKSGCPYCSNKKVLVGYNDLATTHPEIAKQWHPTKNGNLKPTDVVIGSRMKVWWKCENGHEWEAIIDSRNRGQGCPYCAGKYVIEGENDLATLYPEIAKEWHPTKNGDLKPTQVHSKSIKRVWWQCELGHEWESTIASRTHSDAKCPYCANKKVLIGYNDLVTTHPDIAKEWHPTKNGNLKPTDVVAGSDRKVWWKCEFSHEWEANIKSRTKLNTGCPYCSNYKILKDYNDLATTHPEIAQQWHPTKNGNLKPDEIGIGTDKKIWWICEHGHEWKCRVVDRKKVGCPVCSNRQVLKGHNDLETTHPKLAKQWHPFKNGDLKPTDLTAGANQKVWWQCKKGHEWQALVSSRTCQNQGCPVCSNQQILIGYNDLATTHPDLIKEWHPTKNGNLKPTDVVAGSIRHVWWQCKKGHEWEAPIHNRAELNSGCPKCNESRRVSFPEKAIYYYMKQMFPNAHENYKLPYSHNLELDIFIEDINLGIEYDGSFYHRKHDKDARKYNLCKEYGISLIRIREKDCPILNDIATTCYYLQENNNRDLDDAILFILNYINTNYSISQKISVNVEQDTNKIYDLMEFLEEENSLAKQHPNVAKEWHPTKNGKLKPEYITSGSSKKVWWQCEHGHEWEATVHSRTSMKTNCPICSNKKILVGYNDFATTHPEIAKQWHPTKNGDLKPTDFTAGSQIKVWWQCKQGHEWEARIYDRKDKNCPYCSNRKLLAGHNDLATTHPELAKEWHSTKNGDLKPIDVSAGSDKKVWWKCSKCGYEWKMSINNRKRGCGCSVCSNKRVVTGHNDLATTHPDMLKEWLYEKNGELKPTQISAGSQNVAWWKCSKCGYEHQEEVRKKVRKKYVCPNCREGI